MTEIRGGQTYTDFRQDLKILFVHIKIVGKDIDQPIIVFGYIENIQCKKADFTKFEKLVSEFSYYGEKILII